MEASRYWIELFFREAILRGGKWTHLFQLESYYWSLKTTSTRGCSSLLERSLVWDCQLWTCNPSSFRWCHCISGSCPCSRTSCCAKLGIWNFLFHSHLLILSYFVQKPYYRSESGFRISYLCQWTSVDSRPSGAQTSLPGLWREAQSTFWGRSWQ